MEEFIIDLVQVADVDADGTYHARDDKGKRFPQLLVDDGTKTQVKGKIMTAVHGTLKEGGDPASLLIFEFNVTSFNGRRFKKATITITFEDGKGTSANDPEVYDLSPVGLYTLNKVTNSKDITHAIDAAINANPISAVGGTLGYHWTMSQTTHETHSAMLNGLSRRFKSYGEETTAMWVMTEDPVERAGIPSFLRTVVILRHDKDECGEFRFSLEIDVAENKTLFYGKSKPSRMIKPLVLDPNIIATTQAEGIDIKELGALSLDSETIPNITNMSNVTHEVGTMDELCFIVVDGLTNTVTSPEKMPSIKRYLQKCFPQSHYHPFDPFTGTQQLKDKDNILDVGGISLIENITQCLECSAAYQGCQGGGSLSYNYRPIVFIGHDVGGSVIKRALVLANENPSYRRISQATVAIVFFGGLHQTTKMYPWERQIISLLDITERNIRTIFPNIQTLPAALTSVLQSFTGISGSYAIFNVYEKSDSPTIPKESATSNSPVLQQFGCQRSHTELLHLPDEADPTAEWLLQKLTFLTNKNSSINDAYHAFIRYLTQIEPMLHQLDNRPFPPASLDWISELDSFKEWNLAPGIGFLHISGPPGSGTTILITSIFWLLSSSRPATDICYLNFSFNRQDILASSMENLVLSLIRQLLSGQPGLFKHAQRLCTWIMQKRCINLEILWALFESLLSHIGKKPVLLAIRAIQDCNSFDGDAVIIRRLQALQHIPNLDLKVVVTSEKSDWALPFSQSFHSIHTEKLDIMIRMLRGLVKHRIQRLLNTRPAWSGLEEIISERFWDRQPDYNLAMAKVQELETEARTILSTKTAITNILEGFPSDANTLFRRIGEKIPAESWDWLQEALRWVIFALRPLTSQELAAAVAFNLYNSNTNKNMSLKEVENRILSDLPEDINRIVGYWVKVSGGRVEITNSALKSFLVNTFIQDGHEMHLNMLKKCLGYLKWVRFAVSADGEEGRKGIEPGSINHPACAFLEYAAFYWHLHFRMAEYLDRQCIDIVDSFLEDLEQLEFWSSIIRRRLPVGSSLDFLGSPLKISAAFGLIPLVEKFMQSSQYLSETEKIYLLAEAMDLALERGHVYVASELCDKIRDSGSTPQLHKMAEKGYIELLGNLLKNDFIQHSIDDLDALGYSPLFYAAQFGQKEAVDILLRHGAQPNLRTDDGFSALHLTAKIGHVEIARLLVDNGADYTLRNTVGYNPLQLASEGGFVDLVIFLLPLYNREADEPGKTTTPLHLAARHGHTLTCAYLIQNGASIKSLDEESLTPVHLAVLGNFGDTVRILVESASAVPSTSDISDIDKEEEETLSTTSSKLEVLYDNKGSLSPLQLAAKKDFVDILVLLLEYSYFDSDALYDCKEAIGQAAQEGHWESLKALLEHTGAQMNLVDTKGDSALHIACKNNHVTLVNRLLESGKYDANFRDNAGLGSLHIASQEGHVQVAMVLLDKWTTVGYETNKGDKAIHFAAKNGHLDVVKALQQVKDMSLEQDHAGNTPVLIAAMAGYDSVVNELLSTSRSNERSSTLLWGDSFPLHKAALNGNKELSRILLSHGYEVNFPNSDGETALHVAAKIESVDMLNFLIRSGAILSTKNNNGETALCLAVKLGNMKASRTILEAISEENKDFVDFPDEEGNTPLYYACASNHKDIVELLLKTTANPSKRCSAGWTPLFKSVAVGGLETTELLLKYGADHSIKSNNQLTVIIQAAELGDANVMRLLINNGASVNVLNSNGSSALHRAAQNGHLECIKLLVEAGADLNVQKNNGLAPLHFAVVNSFNEVVEYFIKCNANVNIDSSIVGTPLQVAMTFKFEPASPLIEMLISANATMTLGTDQLSRLSEDAFLFALRHPSAFIIELPGEVLQLAITSRYTKGALMLIESNIGINDIGGKYHTALQAAAATQSMDIIEKLLEKQACPNTFGGQYGSALSAAIEKDDTKAVELLLEKGAIPNIEHNKTLAIHRAVMRGSAEIVKAMLDNGVDSSVRDRNGRSLLSYAMYNRSTAIVKYLLDRPDTPIHAVDLSLRTPLMTAVMLGWDDVVKRLLEMGVDPNAADSEGKTPLMRAVNSRLLNLNLIQTLLEYKADPSLKDCRGRGTLYWACLGGGDGRDTLVEEMILPRLMKEEKLSLRGELAFHAISSLTSENTPSKQQAILDILLHSDAIFDLKERDGDGWTAIYTATRFGLAAVEETLVQAMILQNISWQSGELKRPGAWHRQDKAPCLQVSEDGLSVSVGEAPPDPNNTQEPRALIRADHCMPGDGVYYFEVTICEDTDKKYFGIGFCEGHAPLDRMVGWDPGSWGFHGDDGNTFTYDVFVSGNKLDEPYGEGDTIGCGVNFNKGVAFFTKNGILLGSVFRGIKGKIYPAISFQSEQPGGSITANFGPNGFTYTNWESDNNLIEHSLVGKRTDSDDGDHPDFEKEFSGAIV
ncbi:ankyrin repeat-containing domain protein [Trichoderma camerunense]